MHYLIIILFTCVLLLLYNLLSPTTKVLILIVNLVGLELVVWLLTFLREDLNYFLLLTLRVLNECRLLFG